MSNNNISIKPFSQENYTDLNSDSDEYIDLSNIAEEEAEHIFQFHLNFDKLILKHIGKSTHTPDIIIKENFGPNSNMFLYNCVYSLTELEIYKEHMNTNNDNNDYNKLGLGLFLPIIKLIIKQEIQNDVNTNDINADNVNRYIVSSFAIKLNEDIKYNVEFTDWELYWVENINSDEYIKTLKIDKNINPSNIIEKLIEASLQLK
jgi:hypothetical protein